MIKNHPFFPTATFDKKQSQIKRYLALKPEKMIVFKKYVNPLSAKFLVAKPPPKIFKNLS